MAFIKSIIVSYNVEFRIEILFYSFTENLKDEGYLLFEKVIV